MKRLYSVSLVILALSSVGYAATSILQDPEKPGRIIINRTPGDPSSGFTVECESKRLVMLGQISFPGNVTLKGGSEGLMATELPLSGTGPSRVTAGEVIWSYNQNRLTISSGSKSTSQREDSATFTCDASNTLKITLPSGLEFTYPRKPA